ncbi:protein yellow-like [Planococcus citri]|uniref:protein yellow-like n=1 Tax=Planococcus citri TaxID=170843 RepID=UPI0031F7EF97
MESQNLAILVVLLGLVCLTAAATNSLQERFSWKIVDFEFPSEDARNEAIRNGEFIPENNLPLGLERWRNKLFVTLPQWKSGTAATLTYIDLDATTEQSPKLKPYPNWEANQIRRNNGVSKIANVFRVNVDVCDRLWLVDAGVINLLGKIEVIHAPKIQAYDLTTDKLILDYPLPKTAYKDESFFANIIVDVSKEDCNNAYVYLADIMTYSLVVYHLASNDAWRVSHYYFHFDPLSTNYNIGGINFQWHDGIFGLALSSPKADGSKLLYFHPMASTKEFAVSTQVIQNKTVASDQYHSYKLLGCRGRKSESSAESFDDKTGVLFYTLVQKDAVGCWNSKKNYTTDNNAIIASDSTTMSFPNDLKVDKNGTLWVLTDRLPNFMYSKLNYDDVNFRIFSASTEQAIKGTVCDNSSSRLAAVSLLVFVVAGFVHTFVSI